MAKFDAVNVEAADSAADTMTGVDRICRKCGATILDGPCPACLLETGLGLVEDAGKTAFARPLSDFGDFELLEEIGRGGQGVVYRARQKSLNRVVALKVIALGHWATEKHLKRFRLEAEAAASLDHSGVVPIYEIGERDGCCYFSMKLIEGAKFDDLIGANPGSIRRAVELIAKLARTVHYAHERNVLHRDIKPGNILIDANGEPHLTDFGLARLVEADSNVTGTAEVLGTPSYMAPEQAAGETKELTAATDVYGLGAVFYHVLTGHPPFAGNTSFEITRALLETDPEPPRLRNPNVDVDLETICLKCLEKDRHRRYPSALELVEDLERWLRHEPITARRTGVLMRARKWARRNRAVAVLVPLTVLLALAIAVFWWNQLEPPTTGIAVLPFENLSDDKESAFFADGIQDDVLTKLAKVSGLKVISRTSVLEYRGNQNARKIGRALHVTHVLEGSVRKTGDRMHLNAQLIDTRTDAHVWAEEYDRNLKDLFTIQAELAQNIAAQLRAKLSPQEKEAIQEKPTNDLRAYELYSEGRLILIWNDPAGAQESVARKAQLLEQATQRDPNFALAYCALAKAQGDFYDISLSDPTHLESARKAVDAAMRLRPDLGETHREMGRYYYHAGDYDRASEELSIARRTLPNDSETLRIIGEIDRRRNRWNDALANLLKAHELDPRNGELVYHTRYTYHLMRKYDEEQQFLDKSAFAREPEYPAWLSLYLAEIKLDAGDPAGAQAIFAQSPRDFGPTFEWWIYRLNAALYLRDYDQAMQVVAATPPQMRVAQGWADGIIARSRGDDQRAKQAFLEARKNMENTLPNKAGSDIYFAMIAKIDAGLGRKEEAIREGRRAAELMPISKDSMRGPARIRDLALVYAWTGERDLAIEQLELLAKIPAGPSYGELRFNPEWDSLRGNPRFEKMVTDLASNSAKK